MRLFWCWLMMATVGAAPAATLHLCPAPGPVLAAGSASAGLIGPDGARLLAFVDANPEAAGCRSLALGVALETVAAIRALSASSAAQLGSHFTITGKHSLLGAVSASAAQPGAAGQQTRPDARPVPARPLSGRLALPIPARASWVWQAGIWSTQGEALLAQAVRHNIKVLFITVPFAHGAIAGPGALAAFIESAARQGVRIWAVEGDPEMVVPGEHAATVRRLAAYAAYNGAAPAAARLHGVQFDIEPYLLPDYAQAPALWDSRYLALVRALRQAAGALPLELVVPFWWNEKSTLLRAIAPLVDGLCVMNYRTEQEQIVRLATPFLEWGARHGKPVRIALESGPLAPETEWRYQAAQHGELWHVPFERAHFLLLLKQPQPNPGGAAYRRAGQRTLDGSATTFAASPARLLQLLPTLEAEFSAWPSFGGIALHEFLAR